MGGCGEGAQDQCRAAGGGGGRQARVHRSARGRRAGASAGARVSPRVLAVIPALDEAASIGATVAALRAQVPPPAAVVVADGGSRDDTARLAEAAGARVVRCGREMRGRASQMNAGAAAAVEAVGARPDDILIFVHADTQVPAGALEAAAASTARIGEGFAVGAFRCHIESGAGRTGPLLRLASLNHRLKSHYLPALLRPRAFAQGLRVFYGDQSIFVRVGTFESCGGYDASLALMEDADLCVRAHATTRERSGKAVCEQLSERVRTSARRFERRGWVHTTLAQLAVGLAWTAGVSNETLENIVTRVYAPVR